MKRCKHTTYAPCWGEQREICMQNYETVKKEADLLIDKLDATIGIDRVNDAILEGMRLAQHHTLNEVDAMECNDDEDRLAILEAKCNILSP